MLGIKGFGAHPGIGPGGKLIISLLILLLIAACSPGVKSDEDLAREIKELKKEVQAVQEKLEKLQAGQQALLEGLKKPAPPAEAAAAPLQQPPTSPPSPAVAQPPGPQPLTISQLITGKDRYLGTRVTVRGAVGPVLVHHKSLLLKAPEGMVEVLFGKLPDEKMVHYLTSTTLEQPLTVTGMVSLPPKVGAAKLQINAEAIDF